jgi:hypothetical protein
MSEVGLLAEHRRRVPSKALPIIFLIMGVGFTVAGLLTMDAREAARTGLLFAFGGLGLVTSVATWVDIARKTRLDERIRIFGDRVEVATSAGAVRHPFSELKTLEGKVTLYQQTGERIHAYKLMFTGGEVEISGGEFVGVGEQTGSLLATSSGRRIEAWL